MKHFIMAGLLLTGVASFAQTAVKDATAAADKPKREMVTPESQSKALATELSLDAKQQAKVKELFERQEKLKAELKEERKTATDETQKAALRAKAKEARTSFQDGMKGILTPEQYTKWSSRKARTMDASENNRGMIKAKAAPLRQTPQTPAAE